MQKAPGWNRVNINSGWKKPAVVMEMKMNF